MGDQQPEHLRVTEDWIKAVIRFGSEVYLRSERTGNVWMLLPHPKGWVGQPMSEHPWLSYKQVNYHLKNKPHNFSTICPKHPNL
jgi:hypothetical protein